MKTALCFWLVLGLMCAAPVVCSAVEVEATGMGFFEEGRQALGREKALNEAKRAAVEKAAGVHVTSSTEVRNFMAVRDQVLSRASGYLKNFEIIKEGPTPFGTYEATIKAEVQAEGLTDDIDRFRSMLALQKSPRIAVEVRPTVQAEWRPAADKAVSLLNRRLSRAGFTVVDPEAARSGPALLLKLSLECESREMDYEGVKLNTNEVSLCADVVRPGGGEVLASATAVASVPGASQLKALDKGVDSAVGRVYEEVRKDLTEAWARELKAARSVALFVESTPTHREAMQILYALRSDVPGVERAELARYKDKKSRYEVRYKGQPEFLLSELEMSYFQRKYFRFDVLEVSGDAIVLRYRGKGESPGKGG